MEGEWRLLTSHGQVLFYIAAYPEASIPQIARDLELSEGRVGVILRDLKKAGMVRVTRIGRRNHYEVNGHARFRHPSMAHARLTDMLATLVPNAPRVFLGSPAGPEQPDDAS